MKAEQLAADPGFNARLWAFVATDDVSRKDCPEAFEFANVLAGLTRGLLIQLHMVRQGLTEEEAAAAADERIRTQAAMYGSLAAMEATS